MDDDTIGSVFAGIALGTLCLIGLFLALPREPEVKYIYDGSIGHDAASEARLVGFCNGKYLIRTEEDEFPAGCQFIEPIHWEPVGGRIVADSI